MRKKIGKIVVDEFVSMKIEWWDGEKKVKKEIWFREGFGWEWVDDDVKMDEVKGKLMEYLRWLR